MRPRIDPFVMAMLLGALACDPHAPGTASDELEPDQACAGNGDCPEGAYCVADPCPDQLDPNDPAHDGCGTFTCRLQCAGGIPGAGGPDGAVLMCSDALDCCSADHECDANFCVAR